MVASTSDPQVNMVLEHIETMVALLRPVGPDLGRRLLAALALVPEHERADVVGGIEKRIVEVYTDTTARSIHIIDEVIAAKAIASAQSADRKAARITKKA
ncbi:MAG: hypothetical protein IIB26_04820 [Chloroflexi bacterium]|nr:hypothetical protein [Chloroflexota bacterium]